MLLRTLVVTLLAAASGGAASTAPPPILFAADNEPALSGDIFRLDANGHLVNLSKSPFADENPVVSPDGRRVAFVSERGGGPGIYEVGIDGAGLRRLDPPPHQIGGSDLSAQLAWSPDGKLLASVTGILKPVLRILGPGQTPRVVARSSFVYGPSWSPDGRLLTIETQTAIARVERAYTAAGRLARQIPAAQPVGWSSQGLFATIAKAGVRAYDEQGRLRFTAPARAAAWSPDGTRLATVAGGALVVRTVQGRVFLRREFRGLKGRRTNLTWIDGWRVLVNLFPRVPGVDMATGKVFTGSIRYFYEPRSPNGRLLAETARHASQFALEVEPLPHGRPTGYGRVGGCFDDGVFEPQLTALQFVPGRRSLVYESYCGEPLSALYAVNPDATGLTRLTYEQKQYTQPAWSPDGTHIAYTRYDAVGLSCKGCPGSLVVADADGSSRRVLATPQESIGAYAESGPSWSPDGTRILYTEWNVSAPSKLFVVPPRRAAHPSTSTSRASTPPGGPRRSPGSS